MKRSFVWFITVLLPLTVSPLMASQNLSVGFSFTFASPQNEFRQNANSLGFGGNGFLVFNLGNTPFHIGGSLGVIVYGRDKRTEPFSITIPNVTVDVTTTNSILFGHLLFRLQPSAGEFRPYIDGLFGFNYLSTTTKIENQNAPDEEDEIASSTNFDDFTSSYGGGAGIQISLYQSKGVRSSDNFNALDASVLLDFGVKYLIGGEAEYLKERSIEKDPNKPGEVLYDITRSSTDLINYRLGIVFTF